MIIEGVESEAHKEWLQGMEWFAIQGHYWREVSIEQLVADDIAIKQSREFRLFNVT